MLQPEPVGLADDQATQLHPDGSPLLSSLSPPEPQILDRLKRWLASTNIALEVDEAGKPELSDDELDRIGMRVKREYDIDVNSRAEWLDQTKQAMDMAMQVTQQKQYPWPKAANVIWPLQTMAAFQFAARAYPAIIPGPEVVKGIVIGQDEGVPAVGPDGQPAAGPDGKPLWKVPPGAKQDRADRIGEHMSYQLLEEQTEWEPQTDAMLHALPIEGCEFRKSYFDPAVGHNASIWVRAQKVVINYHAKSMETAPRITEEIEFYPLEIEERERADIFRPITYTTSPGDEGDDDAPVKFLEQHRNLDLDEDGYAEPYIVTVQADSGMVVRIVARYEMDGIKYNFTKGKIVKIDPVHYYTKYDFFPNIEGGIYGMGFGHLLKSLNESINTTINMMLDAGHLEIVGGGFIGKNFSMSTGQVRFQPGEWKMVNVTGASMKDSIVPLPAPGASPVLFQLLGLLIEAGKDVAGIKDVLTGETMSANTPATTMLAMVEQGIKGFTAIYKRVHRALKSELAKLYRLNSIYLDQEASYKVGDDWKQITKADYEKGSGVKPVSDPEMVTDMQQLGRAAFLMQFKDEAMMDGVKIRKRMFKAARIDRADELFNPSPQPNPAIIANMLKLQIEEKGMDIKQQEQARKQAHEEASLQLRERHDAALIEREQAGALLARAQAVNQIAQADAAVGQQEVAWAQHQLEAIKSAMDALSNAALADTSAATAPLVTAPGTPEAGAAAQTQAPHGQMPAAQPAQPVPGQPVGAPIPAPPDMSEFSPPVQHPNGKVYVRHKMTGQHFELGRRAA